MIINCIFRLFLTLSALSLFVAIFLINKEFIALHAFNKYLNYIIYILVPFALSSASLIFSKKLGKANMGKVKFVETSNNDFLSNYLAFFFVALSIKNWDVFWFCFGLTTFFTFYSRVSYFNPILLIYRYNFYYITLENNSKVLLITKNKVKSPENINKNTEYKRINDYTFID